ncbi:MAG: NYN domain-containing protein [Bradymonadales bacterium]|jgi:hypothetical protein
MITEKKELIILMDCENFFAIKSSTSSASEFLEPILSFLNSRFTVNQSFAYTCNNNRRDVTDIAAAKLPIELKHVEALIPQNKLKNSVDICLAMDAVRLGMQYPHAYFAILVGGDKDFAAVAAYLRRCLHKHVIAFGSDESPNPSLAQEVNLYFSLQSAHLWEHRLTQWLERKTTPAQRSFLSKLLNLIDELQLPSSCPIEVIEEQLDVKNCAAKLQALGCTLSENKRWVLRWGHKIQASIDQTRDPFTNLHFSPQYSSELDVYIDVIVRALKRLQPLKFPLSIPALGSVIKEDTRELPASFKKKKLSTILRKLDFTLNKERNMILSPETPNALALCEQAKRPIQSSLF